VQVDNVVDEWKEKHHHAADLEAEKKMPNISKIHTI
jgi:hypothetical protein